MYRDPIQYAGTSPKQLHCPVCGMDLEVRLARGRRSGKTFLMAVCPRDGRHIRAFINDEEFRQGRDREGRFPAHLNG